MCVYVLLNTFDKGTLVVLTTESGYPSCRQTEDTLHMRGLLWCGRLIA